VKFAATVTENRVIPLSVRIKARNAPKTSGQPNQDAAVVHVDIVGRRRRARRDASTSEPWSARAHSHAGGRFYCASLGEFECAEAFLVTSHWSARGARLGRELCDHGATRRGVLAVAACATLSRWPIDNALFLGWVRSRRGIRSS
jgi:hypothetical protein